MLSLKYYSRYPGVRCLQHGEIFRNIPRDSIDSHLG